MAKTRLQKAQSAMTGVQLYLMAAFARCIAPKLDRQEKVDIANAGPDNLVYTFSDRGMDQLRSCDFLRSLPGDIEVRIRGNHLALDLILVTVTSFDNVEDMLAHLDKKGS